MQTESLTGVLDKVFKKGNSEAIKPEDEAVLKTSIHKWFEKQPISVLKDIPFCDVHKLNAVYHLRAFTLFFHYQRFMENQDLHRHHPTPFYIAKHALCELAFLIKRKKHSENQFKISFLREDWDFAVLDWIRACYQTVLDEKLRFLFLKNSLSAEEELKRALLDSNQKVRPEFYRNIEKFDIYFRKLIDWFLSQYDLRTAAKIIWTLKGVKKGRESTGKSVLRRFTVWTKRALISLSLFGFFAILPGWLLWKYGFPDFAFTTDVICPIAGAFDRIEPAWPPQIFTTILVVLYPALLLILFMAFLTLWTGFTGWLLFFKLLLPRLTASIMVGYLPLVMSGDAWSALNGLEPVNAFLLISVMLLFSFLFLFLEVHNRVGKGGVAFRRSFVVFYVGLLQSFVIGLIISDWITNAFSVRTNIHVQALPHGLFGSIVPQVLVLMFPFALFIGFFVQLIWQDKAVTQPL